MEVDSCSRERENLNRDKGGEQEIYFLADLLEGSNQPFGISYPNGGIGHVNGAFERLTGYSREELREMDRAAVLTPPEWLARERAVREELCRTGEPVRYEMEYIRRDGARVPVEILVHLKKDEADRPLYYYSFITDITERKELENVVMKSQLDVFAILDNIPYSAWLKDTEGRYVKVNWQFVTFCGLASPKEVIGKTDLDLWPVNLAEAFRAGDREVMASGRRQYVEDHVVEKGVERWFETFKAPRFDQNGTVIGTTGISRDITERKRAEEVLKSARDDLEQKVAERTWELAAALNDLRKESSDRIQALEALREQERLLIHQGRLAAMGEMIGNIAHQWRQPLNTLGLIIQAIPLSLESGELTKEQLDERVDRAMKLIFHMSQTIDDFRNFFRPDKEKVRFELKRVINNALSLVGENFRSLGIRVLFDGPVELSINGYPNEFSQAILNILMNARDVLEERRVHGPCVTLRMFTERNRVVVTISDNAGGIDQEIIEKVFDPYFTSKCPSKGTGLGLFIAKTIVEKNMDGVLSVRNTGEGAEFRIEV